MPIILHADFDLNATLAEHPEEFSAIISLLDDPDTSVQESIQKRLMDYGPSCVQHLKYYASQSHNVHVRRNARRIVKAFRLKGLHSLKSMVKSSMEAQVDIPLEESMCLLSQFSVPEVTTPMIGATLNRIAIRVHEVFVRNQMSNDLTHIVAINRVLFEEEMFRGHESNYYQPANSYLSEVLQRKLGIPLSLAVIYLLVAERSGLQLDAVSVPLHFMVCHKETELYIDTFNCGRLVSREDCLNFMRRNGISSPEDHLVKSTNLQILNRALRNLIYAHEKLGETWEKEQLSILARSFSND